MLDQFVKTSEIVSAIQGCFEVDADACYCTGPAKLSYAGLVNTLVDKGVLDPTYKTEETEGGLEQLNELFGWKARAYQQNGIQSLQDFSALTLKDLMRWPGVGYVTAKRIELTIAGRGVYLRDSDPEKLQAQIEGDNAHNGRADAPTDPALVPQWVSSQLGETADRLIEDGRFLYRKAADLQRGKVIAQHLRRYVTAVRSNNGLVAGLVGPINDVEKAETMGKRHKREAERAVEKAARREAAATMERVDAELAEIAATHPNVVRLAV